MICMVRQVWENNLAEEINKIRQCSDIFGYVSIDTEFPGTIWKPKQPVSTMSPADHYNLMKKNVNSTKIIQLGLTLSDSISRNVWQFNFRDFNRETDLNDPDSIALLHNQGINFSTNKRHGIDSRVFAHLFVRGSGLVGLQSRGHSWITFHGLYDLGYLIKIITGRLLPEDLTGFISLVRFFFGRHVYDLKPIAHSMQLQGGLEKVAKALGLERSDGKSHHAGSDSLLIMQAFVWLAMNRPSTNNVLMHYTHVLYGLTWLPCSPRFNDGN